MINGQKDTLKIPTDLHSTGLKAVKISYKFIKIVIKKLNHNKNIIGEYHSKRESKKVKFDFNLLSLAVANVSHGQL